MRVSEVYLSVQGEGPRVGIPTVFVRFGGCNLRCSGWPCDTPYAIDPKYRKEWTVMSAEEVATEVTKVAFGLDYYNVCLTGGEPFLQNDGDLYDLVHLLKKIEHVGHVECFSNGTLVYPAWAFTDIMFVMDWKLPGSGENPDNGNRLQNLAELTFADAVKFVIKDETDYLEARKLWMEHIQNKSDVEVYYGAVWGAIEDKQLVEWVLADGLPWRLNVQQHNYIWDRSQRGI